MANKWNYNGDSDLGNGGWYWQEDGQNGEFLDYVSIVDVIPEADIGGRSNVFFVSTGTLYLGDKVTESAECCGIQGPPSREQLIYSMKAYKGFDEDIYTFLIQIGKAEPENHNGTFGEPHVFLRGNAKLENYIKNNYLS